MASGSELREETDRQPRPLEPGDLEPAAGAIARAFAWHEPWGAWVLPDEGTREGILRERIGADIRDRFLPHGECWTIGALCLTLWIPPARHPGAAAFAARRSEDDYAAFGARAEAIRAGDELIASLRPDVEHWYLDTIATAPELHGQGLGGALLDHDLAIRDAAGDACALDTHTEANIGFYERRGFEVTGQGPLSPDLEVFMMFRPARLDA